MNWKLLIFKLLIIFWFITAPVDSTAQSADSLTIEQRIEQIAQTRYEQRISRIQQRWMSLIPSLGRIQYAGNIGWISIGFGWDYGRNEQWETLIQLGYLPKFKSDANDLTFTLRENYIPWSIGLGRRSWAQPHNATGTLSHAPLNWNRRAVASFEPLVFTMALNTIFDDEFWIHEPNKYNGGDYYRFSSKIRIHLGIGSRLSFNIPKEKRRRFDRVSLYYDLSTYDLAIITAVPNEKITLGDILCLGIGVQYKFF